MFYQRGGLPEEGEILMCTVKAVHPHSVFVILDEYTDKTGLIHISEVSPGRIRNINDYVKKGKKIVCKVLRVDKKKGHIDLSLRRVNEGQRRLKREQLKKEQLAEKVLEHSAKELGVKLHDLYAEIAPLVLSSYEFMHEAFEDLVADEITLEDLKISATYAKVIEQQVRLRMKAQEVVLKGKLLLFSYASDGLAALKNAFSKITDDRIDIRYNGSGKYTVEIIGKDYPEVNKLRDTILLPMVEAFEEEGGTAQFEELKA